jgi:Tol biopolymer transport system component
MTTTTILGTTLADRYQIERQIGVGGMAVVYVARDVKHDRRVALKLLKPEIAAVLGVERFLSEIRVTAQLQHPNLLPLFDSGEAGGMLYYVMPYVEGESLRERLNREKQLRIDDALHVATAVASALEYAHGQGVIHRDLKPENILIQSGEPVVADFGIALAVSKAGGARVTQTGISLGTPQYMSPEQATGDRQIDGRADIYALGAVLYEMLTGEPPHAGSTVQAILARVIGERPQSIQAIRPAVPDHVVFAVDRALEKLPADRWATAREFGQALQERTSLQARTARVAPRSQRWRVAALAALGVVLFGVPVWSWVHASQRGPRESVAFRLTTSADIAIGNVDDLPVAISPDGRLIAYVGRAANVNQLFIRSMDEIGARPIDGTQGAGRPTFSPDGRSIAFVSNGRLKRVPVDGGPAIELSSVAMGVPVWGPKGTIVIGMRRDETSPGQLAIIPATGGDVTPLTTIDSASGDLWHRWPVVLEDEVTILYTSLRQGGLQNARIAMASLRDGESRVLDLPGVRALGFFHDHLIYVDDRGTIRAAPMNLRLGRVKGPPIALIEGLLVGPNGVTSAALSRSGTLAYMSGSRKAQLVTVDKSGARQAAPLQPKDIHLPRISPDGRWLASVIRRDTGFDIWLYDFRTATPTRLTTSGSNLYPEWSTDSRTVFYVGTRGPDTTTAIYAIPIDGSARARVIVKDGHYFTMHPDGRTIVYSAFPQPGEGQLWARTIGDTVDRLLATSIGGDFGFRVSPDGRWLAYQSLESGTGHVYVRPYSGPGARVQISTTGGSEPRWSRDGQRLYYRDGQRFVAATLRFTPTPEVTARTPLFDDEFHVWWDVAAYDVTSDDKFLLVRTIEESREVVVITNWRERIRVQLRERR